MDANRITSALMGAHFDSTRVHEYGPGFLVSTSFTYSDDDTVTVGVFPLGGGYRVTDRAEAMDRLEEAGYTFVRTNRTHDLIEMIRRQAQLSPIDGNEFEVATYTAFDELPRAVIQVATVAQRLESLRWTLKEPAPQAYRDVVASEAMEIATRHQWKSKSNATVRLRNGQERRFTATVDVGKRRGFVQALGQTDRIGAVEHAYFMFGELEADRDQKLAVVDMRDFVWPEADLAAMDDRGTVVRYREPMDLERALVALEAPALA